MHALLLESHTERFILSPHSTAGAAAPQQPSYEPPSQQQRPQSRATDSIDVFSISIRIARMKRLVARCGLTPGRNRDVDGLERARLIDAVEDAVEVL